MERRWVSVNTASKYLSIHPVTCRRLIDRGLIAATRIGRSIRIDIRKLDEWLERGMNPERAIKPADNEK